MTLRKYSAAKVSTTSKFSASANNFRTIVRRRVSVNIIQAGDSPPQPPPSTYYLWSWGENGSGRLGLGNTTNQSSPAQVGSLTTWTKIDAGTTHSMTIKTDGTLWAWGGNGSGRLGFGNTTYYSSPKQIGALADWSSVSAGVGHTIAVETDGTMWAWGNNYYGKLGLGDTTDRSSPVQVGALTTWSTISAGNFHSLAIKTDGTLWAWGRNLQAQLGLGDTTNRSSPVQVGALSTWSKVSAGYQTHNLAIKTDGTMWAWGSNGSGQLGLGNAGQTNYSSPVQIGALTTWSSIGAGQTWCLAGKTDGTLWTWGSNYRGALGLNDGISYRSSPVQIGALTTWLTIAAGYRHALAIKTNGTLWSWGKNNIGQLGQSDTTDKSAPTQVGALTNWLNVSAGYTHSMAIG